MLSGRREIDMAKVVNFESNEAKLNRLKDEHLNRCDELDKTLNQMELKYNHRQPDADGNIQGDLNDVDKLLSMMAGIVDARDDIETQEKKMGIDPDADKSEAAKALEQTVKENLI